MSQQRTRWVFTIVFFLLAFFVANSLSAVHAQGIIIEPPIPIDPPPQPAPVPATPGPIAIDQHSVHAVIDGPVANVQVTQIFRNATKGTVEGSYVFPLPADAAVSDFQLTVDGQVLEGKLLNKDEARRIYEEIVRQQRDPALLEYIGRNLLQTRVFPIPAGASRKLELHYTQIISQRNGLFAFVYPLRTQKYSASPVQALDITVELRNQPGLRTIYSPNYQLAVQRQDDSSATIGYEASAAQPESDFSLFWGAMSNEIGLNVLSYKPAGEDGFFVVLAAPSVEVDAETVVARDLVLVVDVSGSMQGEKIEQARKAAHFVVDQFNPTDRFNLISFSTGVQLWQSALQPVNQAANQAAHKWIDALAATGSTDINRALLEALAQLNSREQSERPAYLLFLTDGLPTMGETEPAQIMANALNNQSAQSHIRLFTFGVGYDVNTDLLDTLSQELGGRSSYVRPEEAIDEQVGQFYRTISTPILVDVGLEWGSQTQVAEVYPDPLPDLFAGEQLVVVGRYPRGATVNVTLRGVVNGQKVSYHYPGQQLLASGGEPFVARLWATRKIGVLLDQIRRNGPAKELVDEVTQLSLAYGIVTPYTAYLVTELEQPLAGQPSDTGALLPDAETVNKQAYAYAQAAAAAPASGEAAVTASETRTALREAVNVVESQATRYLQGKTFLSRKLVTRSDGKVVEFWVDLRYTESMKLETVIFASPRYFTLLKQPHWAQWLALSSEMIIVTDGNQAIRITNDQ